MFFSTLFALLLLAPTAPSKGDCWSATVDPGQYVSKVREQWSRIEIKDGALVMCPNAQCWRLDLATTTLRKSDDAPVATPESAEWCSLDKVLRRCDGAAARAPTVAELAAAPAGELVVTAALDDPSWSTDKVQVFELPSARWLRTMTVAAPRGYVDRMTQHCADGGFEAGVTGVMRAGPDSFFAIHSGGLSDCLNGSEAAWNAVVALHATRDGARLTTIGSDTNGEFEAFPEVVVRSDGMLAVVTYAGELLGIDPKSGKVVSRLRVPASREVYPALLIAPDGRMVLVPTLEPRGVIIIAPDGKSIARKVGLRRCTASDD